MTKPAFETRYGPHKPRRKKRKQAQMQQGRRPDLSRSSANGWVLMLAVLIALLLVGIVNNAI